jgi:hypothetical protein
MLDHQITEGLDHLDKKTKEPLLRLIDTIISIVILKHGLLATFSIN